MKTRLPVLVLAAALLLSACAARRSTESDAHDYGVFLSYEGALSALDGYYTVVIDAQYYSKEDIAAFRESGHKVYSYLNVGSLEDFRDYWDDYRDLSLGAYEHWGEEVWIDVSSPRWQAFILDTLAPELLEKGIDGFFVDNCDVYYFHPGEDILTGLATVLRGLRADGTPVIINGGDAFVDACRQRGGDVLELASGVNQESVFTAVDWDGGRFLAADADTRAYFTDYVERCADAGLEVFLLEYTTDARLADEARAYCAAHGFHCYVSPSLELGPPK